MCKKKDEENCGIEAAAKVEKQSEVSDTTLLK